MRFASVEFSSRFAAMSTSLNFFLSAQITGKAYNTFYGSWCVLSLYMMHGSCQSGCPELSDADTLFPAKVHYIICLSCETLWPSRGVRPRNSPAARSGTVMPHCGCFVRDPGESQRPLTFRNTKVRTGYPSICYARRINCMGRIRLGALSTI